MKYCTKCGNQMADDMSFCQKCGAEFLSIEQTSDGQEKNSISVNLDQTQNQKNGKKKNWIIILLAILVFFLFIGIVNSFDDDTASISDTEKQEEKQPDIPEEFVNECPVDISASMYDNIIGFPELKCNIKNKTDKEIAAVQLYFLPKDVYGEKANSIFTQNKLQYDTPISANSSDVAVWQLLDKEVKSGDLYVYSVYFSDGTEWGDRNASGSQIKKYAMQMQVSY